MFIINIAVLEYAVIKYSNSANVYYLCNVTVSLIYIFDATLSKTIKTIVPYFSMSTISTVAVCIKIEHKISFWLQKRGYITYLIDKVN